jgi:uncharacterized RDD family membrane protein YckC
MSQLVERQVSGIRLPAGMVVAGMRRRTAAWILDRIFVGLLGIVPAIFAFVAGGVWFNQQALDQIDPGAAYPFAAVTAPLFGVQMGPLVVAAVLYLAIAAAYEAGCWMAFAGTPGQRMLGLQVSNVDRGKRLTFDEAMIRWLALDGLATIIGTILLISTVKAASAVPAREWLDVNYINAGASPFGSLSGFSSLTLWGSLLWAILLLSSSGRRPDHRGLHDQMAASVVFEKVRVAPPMYWAVPPGWQNQGGWTPAGGPYPWYPPQGGPYQPPIGSAPYPGQPGNPNASQSPQPPSAGSDAETSPPGSQAAAPPTAGPAPDAPPAAPAAPPPAVPPASPPELPPELPPSSAAS